MSIIKVNDLLEVVFSRKGCFLLGSSRRGRRLGAAGGVEVADVPYGVTAEAQCILCLSHPRLPVERAPRASRPPGTDAAKKIVGRKRSIVTDTLGLLLAVLVTTASVQDSVAGTRLIDQVAGTRLIDQVAATHPSIRKVWVDGGYRQHLVEHAATLGIDMEIVQRNPGTRGFMPLPRRWTVERTYGWLMFHRRLARDYETLPARSEAMIHLAMTDLMGRRLTAKPPYPGVSRHQGIKRQFRDETSGENDL
jgi:transposase